MRVTIKPSAAPGRELDLTGTLISAVAGELWRNFGGNDVLNWMEAERFVQSLIARTLNPATPPAALSSPAFEPRPQPRPQHRPVRPREDAPRAFRAADEDRITGPLPVL